jgi:hypothetical protein
VQFAIDKACSAVLFRRSTKVFEDALAGGRTAMLALHGAVPIEGGVLIISGGKITGRAAARPSYGLAAPQEAQAAGGKRSTDPGPSCLTGSPAKSGSKLERKDWHKFPL